MQPSSSSPDCPARGHRVNGGPAGRRSRSAKPTIDPATARHAAADQDNHWHTYALCVASLSKHPIGARKAIIITNEWAPPSQAKRTNSFAIAALVCGIVQFAGLFPAGIILGHRALRKIRETGEDGYGLAKAGLILGYVRPIWTWPSFPRTASRWSG